MCDMFGWLLVSMWGEDTHVYPSLFSQPWARDESIPRSKLAESDLGDETHSLVPGERAGQRGNPHSREQSFA